MPRPSSHQIKKIFQSIAGRYDQANKAITFGMDARWRQKLVQWSSAPKNAQVLDCAAGTGALAFTFADKLKGEAKIIGVDFCSDMLNQARLRLKKRLQTKQTLKTVIQFQQADIHSMPFADNTFDVSASAYGIRNTANPPAALKEMARVTKPKGSVLILDTGRSNIFCLRIFFDFYFRFVVPIIGGLVTGQKAAYEHLQQSSRKFPSQKDFLHLMENTACFSHLECKTLFLGASFIYKGRVIS